MKTVNQKNNINNNEDESEINWMVVGPILAVLLATAIWAIFF